MTSDQPPPSLVDGLVYIEGLQTGGRGAYNSHFKKWRVVKSHGTTGQHSGTRAARATPRAPDPDVEGPALEDGEFDLHMHMRVELPDPLPFKQFEHHESILKSVDDFIYGVFDSREKKWSANIAGFLDADDQWSAANYHWRVLSDQCHGVALLIRSNLHAKAERTLDILFNSLRTVDEYRHPAFMVEFWRMCIRVQGVDCHIPNANAVKRFLSLLKEQQQDNNPVRRLVNSLISVDAKDLRNVLRIGYVKAIRTMTALIGDENFMVLDMLSFYCRFFSAQFVVKLNLAAKFKYVWFQTDDLRESSSTANAAISYAHVYAAYYVLDTPYLAIGMAQKLRDILADGSCRIGPLAWTLETEAFSFTSQVVGELHRQRARATKGPGHYQACCESMRSAIFKLETGDRECRTRAARLSKVLNRWLVEWGLQNEADEEALRTRRIEESIPGKHCLRCLRVRYCTSCARDIASGNPRDEGCNRCNRQRFSKVCQKCALRQTRVGWKPSVKRTQRNENEEASVL